MDGTTARLAGPTPGLTEPKPIGSQEAPGLRLAGTAAFQGLDPADERLGALRNACCLLERLKAEAAALDSRSQAGRGDPMTVVTGRNAKDELIEIADLVTEMAMVKHPFRSGVKAQAGSRQEDQVAPRFLHGHPHFD